VKRWIFGGAELGQLGRFEVDWGRGVVRRRLRRGRWRISVPMEMGKGKGLGGMDSSNGRQLGCIGE
jgi:hypothetical protein